MFLTHFTFCPGGRQAATYRLREAISAGSVPVVVDDRTMMPYAEVIDWSQIVVLWVRCVVVLLVRLDG